MPRPFAPQQLGKYFLLRKIASGGMAEVFLARSEGAAGFQKTVVIKRILPNLAEDTQFVEMFLNEARVASQLNHPNVVSIYELGEIDGSYYISMEYIDGPNLRGLSRRAIDAGQRLEPFMVAKMISMACEGLQYAHDAVGHDGEPLNLIHRDISPDNILLSRQGSVKVVDFGIAKAANQPHLTKSGMLKGKLSYMPPEQIRGHVLDRRADVFALGVCMYELLAGTKPFESTSEVAVMQAILHEPPGDLAALRPDVDAELLRIIERSLEKDRDRRYGSCQAFQTDLDAYLLRKQVSVSARDLAHLVEKLMGPAVPITISQPSMKAAQGSGPRPLPSEQLGPKVGTPPNFNTDSATAVKSLIASAVDVSAVDVARASSGQLPGPVEAPRRIGLWLGLGGAALAACLGIFVLVSRPKPAPQVVEIPAPVRQKPAPPKVELATAPAPTPPPTVPAADPAPTPKADPAPVAIAEPTPPAHDPVAEAKAPEPKKGAERTHRTRRPRHEVATVKSSPATLPVQPAAVSTGKIEVRVLPYADDVIIDGKHYGQTPLGTLPTVSAGRHHLTLLRAGTRYEQEVSVPAGGVAMVKHRFEN